MPLKTRKENLKQFLLKCFSFTVEVHFFYRTEIPSFVKPVLDALGDDAFVVQVQFQSSTRISFSEYTRVPIALKGPDLISL